jgi:uncharacterized protein
VADVIEDGVVTGVDRRGRRLSGLMMGYATSIQVLAVLFVATLIRSAFGFGEALVAVPLLALMIPVEVAAPLATLVSVTVAGVIIVQDWREIHARSAWRLVSSTFLGIPLGLLMLKTVPEPIVKMLLAVVIVSFSMDRLVRRRHAELKDDRWAWFFGFGAGILGGAYGMNGPPLVVYGTLRRWSPQHFRATLQGYFLPASLAGLCGYWLAGFWVPAVTNYFLLSLPIVLAAIVLGRLVNQRLKGPSFLLLIHLGLVVIGVVLLAQSLIGLSPQQEGGQSYRGLGASPVFLETLTVRYRGCTPADSAGSLSPCGRIPRLNSRGQSREACPSDPPGRRVDAEPYPIHRAGARVAAQVGDACGISEPVF